MLRDWVTAIASIISACAALYAIAKVREVHVMINSRLTEMLKLNKSSSFAEGRQAERDSNEVI